MDNNIFRIIKENESFIRITGPIDLLPSLYGIMKVRTTNYKFSPLYKSGVWDGYISFMKNNRTLIGLLPLITEYLDTLNYPYEIDDELKNDEYICEDDFETVTRKHLKTDWYLHEHQSRGAIKALSSKRGIINHCTSAGKTATCWSIINFLMKTKEINNVLMIVPKISLVEQSVQDFIDYGMAPEDVGRFYGEAKEPDKKVVVSTWQSLNNKKDVTKELLQSAEVVICDEVHSAKAKVLREIMESCYNASYKIGVTGTLPEEKCDKLTIQGLFGPVLDVVKTKELQDKNIVSDAKINIMYLQHPKGKKPKYVKADPETEATKNWTIEEKFINEHTKRNKIIKTLASTYINKRQNVLIMFDKLKQGENIRKECESIENVSKLFYIEGAVNVEDREKCRKYIENMKDDSVELSFGDKKIVVPMNTKIPLSDGSKVLASKITKEHDILDSWILNKL